MREPISFTAFYRFLSIIVASCLAVNSSFGQQLFGNDANPYLDVFYGFLLQANPVSASENKTKLLNGPGNEATPTISSLPVFSTTPSTPGQETTQIPELKQPQAIGTNNATLNDSIEALFDSRTTAILYKYADLIEAEPEDVENYYLYKFIEDWYGVKYKWGGTSNKGIDCSAFSQKLYSSIYNVKLLRTSRQQHKSCEPIKKFEDAQEGDLVFFKIRRFRISHVGVYLANGHFVHATKSKGVQVSSLNEKYWHRRYAGCGRIERQEKEESESDFLN
jgi:cell wall-associated NlpC family hydrolase